MRVSDAWSHDVVLRALCDAIDRQRRDGTSADFILATGDLAYSGKAEEYRLAAGFFDAISTASGVPKSRIFSVPGNHDIDRERQRMCFAGCRHTLQSRSHVDLLLAGGDDLTTLLQRQENYRAFQSSYFAGQDKNWTADGLGYVSSFTIDDVRLAIAGLDSAWLAEGGLGDHGRLLIGERQAINALDLISALDPHIVIAMAHHPFHLLQEFERLPVQSRVERSCHFFHCGHLHEPEARNVGYAGQRTSWLFGMCSACSTPACGSPSYSAATETRSGGMRVCWMSCAPSRRS